MIKKPLSHIIVILLCILSRGANAQSENIPSISIDSMFKTQGILYGKDHARRMVKGIDLFIDSMAKDNGFVYYPNYRMDLKKKADYTFRAILNQYQPPGKSIPVASFRGYLRDNRTNREAVDMGCYGRDPNDTQCFCLDASAPDSINFQLLTIHFYMGFVAKNLVPFQQVLKPRNNKGRLKSFSINEIIASSAEDRSIALNLTHLLNNIMVFNQSGYPRSIITNQQKYNYYDNYKITNEATGKKSDFVIKAELKRNDNNDFVVNFFFSGKEINLSVPQEIPTAITLDADRIEKDEDYSEAMFKISPILSMLRFQNLMF